MKLTKIAQFTCLSLALGTGITLADDFLPYGYEAADPYGSGHSSWGTADSGGSWSDLSWELTSMWQYRYVTEGRRRVKDAQFLMTDGMLHLGPLNLGAWWAQALTQTSYNRLDAYANTSFRFDAGTLTLDVRRVFYPTGKSDHSWEAGAGFDLNTGTWFTPFARTYYDFDDIDGGFLEAGVKAPFNLFDKVRLMPFALLGLDYGYVDQGDHRPQLNHFQIGAEMRWNAVGNWQLYGNLNHSFSLSGLDEIEQNDVTWGGMGVRFKF
jgi:hypothetical protein